MTFILPQRRLIPKWRPVATTVRATEALTLERRPTRPLEGRPDELAEAIANWTEYKTPGFLGDVLSFSVHADLLDQVIAVGEQALRIGAPVTRVQAALIHDLRSYDWSTGGLSSCSTDGLQESANHPFQAPIRRLRALLRTAPDNALALLDYAQLQATVGKPESADKALRTALSLAPNNRTVLRTVARFYVHARKTDLAHHLIRRHRRTAIDPWLMASEIAIADMAGVPATYLQKGKRYLHDQKNMPPAHLTELAGVIAMAELASGNLKLAREAQRRALLSPNDNVAAQAIDLEPVFGIDLSAPQVTRAIAACSEAQLLRAWAESSPEAVERHAKVWHAEEPFSSRPIHLLTTTYLHQGRIVDARRWIQAGLRSDPNDAGLLINLAFLQAKSETATDAQTTIRRVRALRDKGAEPFIRATEGVLEYRSGNFDVGDRLYDEAVAMFESMRRPTMVAYCRLNQALSAIDFGHSQAESVVAMANAALAASPSDDANFLLKIRSEIDVKAPPTEKHQTRLTSQWVFDPKSNTLTERPGITRIGAAAIVFHEGKTK